MLSVLEDWSIVRLFSVRRHGIKIGNRDGVQAFGGKDLLDIFVLSRGSFLKRLDKR